MNRDIYRLVFNAERNAWVAVAENIRGRGKKSSRRRLAAVALGLLVAGTGSALAGPLIPAANALPIPSSGARPFVFSGSVNGGQPSVAGNAMTINTPSRTLGLNWSRFDLGSDASLTFNQPDATSRVLNRIWSADPSVIMGRLTANGEVYLINQNGILFGNGAQVNVGGLVASALNMSEGMLNKLLNSGLPTTRGDTLEFAWDGTAAAFNSGFITVDAGARISTPSGARVVLLAPKSVENLGLIEGGAGAEAILAAGGKVILTAPDDPNLRGLLVETQSFVGADALGNSVRLDGSVTNKGRTDTGSGGVVSLAALAVNQQGIVNASKAVNLNGTTMLVSGTTETERLTINQRGDVAEIDWVSGFNVGAGKTVEFVQQSVGAVIYNYVNDTDRTAADGSILNVAGRSSIDGILKANGQLVLINEQGFDFRTNARVSASNFVASALGMNPAIVSSGLLGQTDVATRAFYLNRTPTTYSASDPDKQPIFDQALAAFRQATVNVDSGARIESGANGYVILAGSKINQAGSITSTSGQAVLAAGADLYLKPAYSSAMRGFSAEVNPLYVVDTDTGNRAWTVLSRGSDANSVTNSGSISAPLGDITLVGNEITQAGRLRTSTSATANGSIHLVARDQLNIEGDGEPTVPSTFWRKYDDQGIVASTGTSVSNTASNTTDFVAGMVGGKLTLADGSTTFVEIDGSNGKTLTAGQALVKSSIDAVARQIVVGDADVEASGGNIRFRASEGFNEFSAFAADPATPNKTATPPAGVGIFIGDGARIDASGANAEKSVADLFIEVELRGDEFANNPLQRNSILRGQKAWVDIRDPVKIADLSGWVNKVGQTVHEKTASGGSISFGTTGSVILKNGSELDVSGGKISYTADTVQESRAISASGKRYRLNDAPPSMRYGRLIKSKHKEAAYVEGRSAGTVELVGHSLAVDGQLTANSTIGTRQREIGTPATNRYALPYGGQLIIKDAGQHTPVVDRDTASEEERIAAYTQAQIAFVKDAARAENGLTENSAAGARLELSQSLVSAGFSRFDITSDGRIDIPADVSLKLPAGGSFTASGRQIYVAGDISAPGGSISLKTRDNHLLDINDAKFSTLTLASSAALSTAGRWVNDYLDGRRTTSSKAIDGGSISLSSAYDLDLRDGSAVDVSGGGWVSYRKKLTAGDAGSITLATGGVEEGAYDFTGDGDRRDASLFLDGKLSGYALGEGGTLTIKTSKIQFGETFSEDSRAWSRDDRLAKNQVGAAFAAGFVDQGGFFSFNFVGRDGVSVADHVRLSPDPVSWSLAEQRSNYIRQRSGSSISDFAQTAVLHPDLRSAPTSISLATRSLAYGDLLIGENAYVGVSPLGNVKLAAWGQLSVLGTLEALAGTISLTRPADKDDPYNIDKITYSDSKQSESIYLGANSRLLAGGTTVLNARTRRALQSGASPEELLGRSAYKGSLLDGGTVSIDAGLGYLVTRSGSLIDVSGTTDTLNLADLNSSSMNYPVQTVGSAGGTVSLAARDGMFVDGAFKASGGKNALGGTFSLRFSDIKNDDNAWGLPDISLRTPEQLVAGSDRQLTLYQSADRHADLWPATINSDQYLAGTALIDPLSYNGKTSFDLASLVTGGFGSWYLASQNEMRFSGAISAGVNNQIRLNAPKFSAADDATRLSLKAAAVQIGNLNLDAGAAPATANIGAARADIRALDIGLVGTFGWNGFASSKFTSQGEIHFDSITNTVAHHPDGRTYDGQMTASGNLTFAAARLSPSTYSDFRVDLLSDADGSITTTRPAGAAADASLSVGGRLELAASTITHHGTIAAPLGEIVLSAPGGKVTLGADSVTSVAADRKLLFGYTTESVTDWNYNGSKVDTMPTKGILIDASDTVVASGAKLDLSGGGDALAWEFTAGPGGKADVLTASSTTFAIIPDWKGFSATDSELQQGYLNATGNSIPTVKAGDRISLASNPAGLSGSYVLLPARYAVLPGAYLITVKSSGTVLRNTQTQADGSWLVNGSRLAANADGTTTAYSTTPLTVELANSNVVGKRAQYTTTSASQFFYDKDGVPLPGDAGRLTVIGRNSLVFDPSVVAMRVAEITAADGRTRAGRGLELDLAAPKLLVSDNAAAPDASWSVLDQNKLNALGASSLLIGGARAVSGTTTNIDTIATDVQISNSGNALTASELLLTATENLTLTSGSRIDTTGSAESRNIVLNGDGAFLRTAEGEQASLSRAGGLNRTQGDLNVQAGASVAGQSLVFDATRFNTLDGSVTLGKRQSDGSRSSGGAIAIGAGRINVVGDGTTPGDGLTLDNADLQRFASADQIRLTSYSTLDLYGNATLGTASLKELVIAAAGLAGHGNPDGVATIAAQSVSFENPNPDSAVFTPGATLGDGKLDVKAVTINFGNNATEAMREAETAGFAMRGFNHVTLDATTDLRFAGTGVTAIDNDTAFGGSGALAKLSINAGRVVTVGTADHLLSASGATTVSRNANAGNANSATGLGGSLDLRARSLDVSGRISAAAGKLTLTGSDYVKVLRDAYVAAEGVKVAFDDTYAYAPGGSVTLKSDTGNVSVEAGAVVSVSADAKGGDAGTLSLVAQNGTVSAADGTLRGSAASDAQQGALRVDAQTVELDTLANAATDADGKQHLTGSWDILARAGNLNLSKRIAAENVTIAADNGGITVGATGVIDASGAKGGKIGLYGLDGDVVLDGQLLARGSELVSNASNAGTRGQGGQVELSAGGTGKVVTGTGSVIDVGVADGSVATGGKVNFRAAKSTSIANASDLNIQLAGTVLGASDVGAEIVSSYTGSSLTAVGGTTGPVLGLSGIKTNLNSLYSAANMALLRSHLGFTDSISHVRAGAEITSTSTADFTIANDLDFSTLRFQGEAGVLTLRAQGNLKINNSISDGFGSAGAFTATSRDAKVSGSDTSWRYRLIAGADTTAARLTAVKSLATAGNIEIASSKLVRTGTADITLAAQGNITLKDKAVVYTAGRDDPLTLANFAAAPGPNDNSATGQRSHYLRNGGDLDISAGGNISQVSTGALTDWLVSYSKGYDSTQWWARIASFQHGFAAFGGGDLNLAAGGKLTNVTAAIPTNARVPGINGEARPELAVINGGGNLSVKTSGSIDGGLFYAESGRLDLKAGKSIVSNPVLAMGNTATRVSAMQAITLGNMMNPMANLRNGGLLRNSSGGSLGGTMASSLDYRVRIGTYGEDSRVNVTSVNGDVEINSAADANDGIAPSRVSVAALNGSISAELLQMPGTSGQLDLLAANNIIVDTIAQYDIPAYRIPGISNPIASNESSDPFDPSSTTLPARLRHSSDFWHAGDHEPSRLIALNGNVESASSEGLPAVFNEAVSINAGKNIENLSLDLQHAHSSDVSSIVAGGDIRYDYKNSSDGLNGKEIASAALGIKVTGPGAVALIAGKDIDLADTWGIVSSGNLNNPYLPEGGASILAMAGGAPDYASLRAYLGVGTEVSDADLRQRFFTLLRDHGKAAQAGGGDNSYEKGRALASALFPTDKTGRGDIKLSVSQIKTEQDGDIHLLAPGGGVVVGVAAPTLTKKASQQGIFTVNRGNIFAYVDNNFLVNQSRVFTLNGGDILIWADRGNIDAGSGSKTLISTPPPVPVIRNGQVVLDTSNSVAGSGIGVLASRDDTPASDMSLFAPEGAIDAGDAGLRSTGNITLGARTILNASNIQAAGSVTGAPAPVASVAPAAAPSSPTNSDKGEAQVASSVVGNRDSTLGILSVEVLEGGEPGAGSDSAANKDDDKKKR